MVFTKLVNINGKVYEEDYNYVLIINGSGTRQESGMVVAMLDACIRHFKKWHGEITTLYARSDNAANLKNETMIRYLKGVNVQNKDEEGVNVQNNGEEEPPLKVAGLLNSESGDGKARCDRGTANCNAKIDRWVAAGNSINDPSCQAQAIVDGNGVANTIVMLGTLHGEQPPITDKQFSKIGDLHEFLLEDDEYVTVRRVCGVGDGKKIKLPNLDLKMSFKYKIVNEDQLDQGKPTRKTSNPFDKSVQPRAAGDQPLPGKDKKLTTMEYCRDRHIQNNGMEQLQEVQPDVKIGAQKLLKRLDVPEFSSNLLELQAATKQTPIDWTLQDLKVGHALPVWGSGKNKKTNDANTYLTSIFNNEHVLASEAESRMQAEIDPATELPRFDADSFLDEAQIRGVFASLNRPRKNTGTKPKSTAKRQAVSTSTVPGGITGLDFNDGSNGEDQQRHEQAVQDLQLAEQIAAMDQDTAQIENDLEDYGSTDPIMVAGENLCKMSEMFVLCIGKPLKKLSSEKKQTIVETVELETKRRCIIMKNDRRLVKTIVQFVRQECPNKHCGYGH